MESPLNNSAFRVILNTEGNPYAKNINDSYTKFMQQNTGTENLQRALDSAIKRIRNLKTKQENIYTNLSQALGFDLKDLGFQHFLNDYASFFNNSNTQNEQDIDKDEAIKRLQQANDDFQKKFTTSLQKIAMANDTSEISEWLDEIDQSIREVVKLIQSLSEEDNSDIKPRLERIKNSKRQKGYNFQAKQENGELIITKISSDKETSYRETKAEKDLNNAIKQYIQAAKKLIPDIRKGTRLKNILNLEKVEKKLYQTAEKAGFNEALIFQTVTHFLRTGEILNIEQINRELIIKRESGFVFENADNALLIKALKDLIDETPKLAGAAVSGETITKYTRVIYTLRQQITNKEKKEIHEELIKVQKKVEDMILSTTRKLDKIDHFVALDLKENGKYAIAISNKLYSDINNIGIVTSSQSSEGATLLHTYDLLQPIGRSANAFIFSALNASQASIFYQIFQNDELRINLEQLLMTFIFDVAYNPKNFIGSVLSEQDIFHDIKKPNVLYAHRIGPSIVPSFIILENVINVLEEQKNTIEKMVKVSLTFDNTPAETYIKELNKNEGYKNPNGEYNDAAWQYVAKQVAERTFLEVHLSLLASADRLNKPWIDIKKII